MFKKLGVFCLVLLTTLVCNRVDGNEDNYEISYVDCTTESFVTDDELIIEIELPEGMEIPETYSTWLRGDHGIGCRLKAVITNGELFPDSNGNPLTNFEVETGAMEGSDNTVSLRIATKTTVWESGWFTDAEHSSSKTRTILYRNLQLDTSARPTLRYSEDYPRVAQIAYQLKS
jgi:hypothetical protein